MLDTGCLILKTVSAPLVRKARMRFTYVTILQLLVKVKQRLNKRTGKEEIISIKNTPLDGKIIALPVNTT